MNTKLLFDFNLVKEINDDSLSDWINFWSDKADLLRPGCLIIGLMLKLQKPPKAHANTCSRPFMASACAGGWNCEYVLF